MIFESFTLDPSSEVPMFRQLYSEIRDAILSGRLKPGSRLPSTRVLAEELGISRNTILNAFDQLLAEGYLQGKTGSGTYVSEVLVEKIPVPNPDTLQEKKLSKRGETWSKTQVGPVRTQNPVVSFRAGNPAVELFPFHIWSRITSSVIKHLSIRSYGYGDPAGYRPLREAIAQYLQSSRGVRCDWQQVLVVSGSQQALTLASHLLIDPGDPVWMEDPGYLGARGAFLAAGARVIPRPVDQEGLVWKTAAKTPRILYISPSHQYPLGITMTLGRRLELLEFAARTGTWILEDDYDSEFRYSGRPIAALQGLDQKKNVIYLGTFSKVLFPALRLGYIVVPDYLTGSFCTAHAILDRHSTILEQAVLAAFISEGYFSRHIRKMRHVYHTRQKALLEIASRHLNGLLEVKPSASGMHLVGWLPEGVSDSEVSRHAALHGLEVSPLSIYAINKLKRGGLLLGYSGLDSHQIEHGCRLLAKAIKGM